MPVFTKNNVSKIARKQDALEEGGVENIGLVLDWDRTCTPKEDPTSHRLAFLSKKVPIHIRAKEKELQEFYEQQLKQTNCHNLQRNIFREWNNESFKLLASCNLTVNDLYEAAKQANAKLREEIRKIITWAQYKHIPITIFSGGFTNTIEVVLVKEGIYREDIVIVANKMEEKDGRLSNPIPTQEVMPSDKVCSFRRDCEPNSHKRKNIILIGDSQQDHTMASDETHSNVFRHRILFKERDMANTSDTLNYDLTWYEDELQGLVNYIVS